MGIFITTKKTLCSVFFVTYLTIKMANRRDHPAERVLKQAADMQLVLAVPLAAGRQAVQELMVLRQVLCSDHHLDYPKAAYYLPKSRLYNA